MVWMSQLLTSTNKMSWWIFSCCRSVNTKPFVDVVIVPLFFETLELNDSPLLSLLFDTEEQTVLPLIGCVKYDF